MRSSDKASPQVDVPVAAYVEVSGLTKTEAEDFLDWLEANGYEAGELSYRIQEGFSVRFPQP